MDVACLGILVADAIARPVDGLPEAGTLGLVDEVGLRGGGCALNTATALARLGLETAVFGRVGEDALGSFLLGLLDERGLDRRGVRAARDAPTSASVVLVDSRGERTFLHVPGANARLSADDLQGDLLFSARALHLGGALVLPGLDGAPAAAILEEARARGLVTSVDTVWDATGGWGRILPALPFVDVFSPSLAEARAITRVDAPEEAAARLRGRGVGTVALTLGAEGCYVAGEGFAGLVEGFPVEAVDGTGSGDAFVAGLLYGVLAGWPLERSARLANALGALAVTAVGAVEGLRGLDETLAFAGLGGQ